GWLLAWGGGQGYDGELLNRHLTWALVLCGLTVLTLFAHAGYAALGLRGLGLAYLPLLLATLVTMTLVGHQGGSLTHGETFLTQLMPQPLRSLLGLPEVKPKHREAKTHVGDPEPSKSSKSNALQSVDPIDASTRPTSTRPDSDQTPAD